MIIRMVFIEKFLFVRNLSFIIYFSIIRKILSNFAVIYITKCFFFCNISIGPYGTTVLGETNIATSRNLQAAPVDVRNAFTWRGKG